MNEDLPSQPTPSRPVRRVVSVFVLVLTAAGLVGVGQRLNRLRWFSDPSQPRAADLRQRLAGPAPGPPAIDARGGASMTLTQRPGTLEIAYSAMPLSLDPVYGYSVHELQGGEPARVGEGTARLDEVMVAYGDQVPGGDDYSVKVAGRFFHGNLQPWTPEEVEAGRDRGEREIEYRGRFPTVRFVVGLEGLDEVTVLRGQVFDVRTRRSICSGYSSGYRNGVAYLEGEVKVWHQTPVLVALDLAHGPVRETLVEPEPGAVIFCAWGELRFVAFLAGTSAGMSQSSVQGSEHATVTVAPGTEEQGTVLVFHGLPQASPLPLSIDTVDAQGEALPSGGGGSSQWLKTVSVRSPRSQIAKIRVREYPHIRRILFELPEIPGLPEENREVRNLFDVRVPSLRLQRAYALGQVIGELVQLDVRPGSTLAPAGLPFPRVYTNTTPRDLVKDYLQSMPMGRNLVVNEQTWTLEVQTPWWERLERDLQRVFGR